MAITTFQFELYRLLLEKPRQKELFENFPDRSDVLLQAFTQKPSIELRQTVKWHVGNVEVSESGWIYFLLGKTSLRKQEHFNEETRDFEEMKGEESPFTYGVLNPKDGVLGLAKRSKVAPNTETVANRLERILNHSNGVLDSRYSAKIKQVSDPWNFFKKVRAASVVRYFRFYVSPSNPIDIEGRFFKPNKDLVDESGASEGEVSIKGKSLDKGIVVGIANSVNSVGDSAKARIVSIEGKKPELVSLQGDPAKVQISEIEIQERKADDLIEKRFREVTSFDQNE